MFGMMEALGTDSADGYTAFWRYLCCGASGRSNACLSVVGRVNNMGAIMYSFNLNISPKMSHGVLECDTVMLQNDVLMVL